MSSLSFSWSSSFGKVHDWNTNWRITRSQRRRRRRPRGRSRRRRSKTIIHHANCLCVSELHLTLHLANDLESHLCFDDDVAKTNYHQASLFRFEFLPWPVWKSAAKQSNSLRSTGQAGWLAGEMINAEQAEMVICINLDLRSGQYGSPSHFSLAGV